MNEAKLLGLTKPEQELDLIAGAAFDVPDIPNQDAWMRILVALTRAGAGPEAARTGTTRDNATMEPE
jgi:hypothetical protein